MSEVDVRRAIAAERCELAVLLEGLPPGRWDAALLVLCGRTLPVGRLHGQQSHRFTSP